MREMDSVVSVIPDSIQKPQTSRSWNFLGFPEDVKRNTVEESNTIIGVIDTGIWIDADSFKDTGFGPAPTKWKGICQDFTCNNKVIGARHLRLKGLISRDDIKSPNDTNGHGSHCASIAAGNIVRSASVLGFAPGTSRGGVPSARIAVYKVCWEVGCSTVDILAAYDYAIADGVDILSVSVGATTAGQKNYFDDPHSIGAFHAMKKGILTSTSADNLGPTPYTTSKLAPWLLSVAASTTNTTFLTRVQLGNGKIYEIPLVYGGDATKAGANSTLSSACFENALDATVVKGKILLCDKIPFPSFVGLAQGAAGVIIRSDAVPLDVSKVFALPAVHISLSDGNLIYSYLKSSSYEGKDTTAPNIGHFSSRGPNKITPEILKPDLAAPGVNIVAGWSPLGSISEVKSDPRRSEYNVQFGTSMACPHVTAAAAYVKTFHPNWSPAVLKSALMTTATPINGALKGDNEFAYGAGQINPIKAVNPGLVYDATETDYVKFLCGQNYSTAFLQKVTGDNSTCTGANKGSVLDLNLPSFALSTTRSKTNDVTFSRTVTNVGSSKSSYKAKITTPSSSLSIKVEPNVLSFSALGEKKTFTLKIEGKIDADTVSSSLVWDDGTFQVRSPVVVYVLP
ncbi:unnamed protein product [Sphenostylis stenocarpa]|uniref:Cucumisin n=1 Tax=Sphenostylis stenocarpa TaxID=92480 RepID=A0AA86VN14_9FABA|nr:unnamed protein product [Sphenostylis stenocarpa]